MLFESEKLGHLQQLWSDKGFKSTKSDIVIFAWSVAGNYICIIGDVESTSLIYIPDTFFLRKPAIGELSPKGCNNSSWKI